MEKVRLKKEMISRNKENEKSKIYLSAPVTKNTNSYFSLDFKTVLTKH